MAVCEYCGKELTEKSHHAGKVRRFCNNECFKASRGSVERRTTICQYCGKTFKETRDRPNLYCSKQCAARHRGMIYTSRRQAQDDHELELLEEYREALKRVEDLRYRIEHEKYCIECGKLFTARQMGQKCCSPECSRRRENRGKDHRIYKNGAPDKSITLTKLYMRDGGICQICGRAIDFDRDPNDDRYPSIDHIIPISKGGIHG